ncbi:hypothetical protein [Nocardioides sp.]|uniref:hypothetical protein n=1 Tax=Nocardioides sp. TaxID=35761 RepID=UPI003513BD7C
MEALFALFVVAFIALCFAAVPVLIVVGLRNAKKRRESIAAWARDREWEYRPSDHALVDRFQGAPFGRGSGRRATNVVLGRYLGRDFTAFDYHWTTGSGDDSTSHGATVLALHLGVHAPELAVGPTTTLRRWVDGLTGRDIEIGDPAFDQAFTVHSSSPEFARDVLLSEVRDVMRAFPTLSWRITGDSILAVRPGGAAIALLEQQLQAMSDLLDRIPQHVWDRLRGETPR